MKLSVKQMMLSGAIFFAASVVATAQTVISIETQRNAMAFQVEQNNDLNMIYYGKKLSSAESYREINAQFGARNSADYTKMLTSAYTSSGSRNLVEPAIAVTHADGNNSLDLKYVSHEIKKEKAGVEILKISLKDPVYAFEVDLFYKSFFEEDMIEQWSVIRHSEKGAVTLHKYASANLTLRENSYWLRHYHGDWAKEMQAEEDKLAHGIKTLDTKLGARANLFQPPSFMVSIDKPATEDEGAVLFGSLEWSGNFKIDFEVDPTGNLRIIPGINNFASDYSLKSGAEFETPPFVHTLSHEGKGRASRNFHDWARKHKILDGMGERLTLLNNWEATYFDFDEKKLTELLKDTKKLGVDLFLLDDGWFANKYPRNNDRAGLGDWQENKTKLPSGI
ncbi:MAG: alpha-galactosidase, partial [Prolixibacteraceae bacterium]|nr:alpha-galactosidase [Prolixibacteraceae bacterium]